MTDPEKLNQLAQSALGDLELDDPFSHLDSPSVRAVSRLIEVSAEHERRINGLLDPSIERMLYGYEWERRLYEEAASGPSYNLMALAGVTGRLPEPHDDLLLGTGVSAISETEIGRLAASLTEEFEAAGERFLLPQSSTVDALLDQYRGTALDAVLARYSETEDSLKAALEGMTTPWLDHREPERSVTELAKLFGMGNVLDRFPPFSEQVTESLRVDFGDWREPVDWSEKLLGDLAGRRRHYADAGFDLGLANLPAPVFRESIDRAGLRPQPGRLTDIYGAPVLLSSDDEDAADRTNEAHGILYRLEHMLRRFIESAMTDAYGPDWFKHRLPQGKYEAWREKRQKAEQAGKPVRPLIDYADFTDYEQIICRGDNWREIFKPIFLRKESIQEAFHRLRPVRLDAMHARPVSQDDILLLFAESRRICKAIRNGAGADAGGAQHQGRDDAARSLCGYPRVRLV